MASLKPVGSNSPTRSLLITSTEQIMLDDGYAAVTYRNVAAKAGLSLGAVQHYFASLDELFLAVVRHYSERNLETMVSALRDSRGDVLSVLWECSGDEVSTALFVEIMALANHRKSIRAEITAFAREYRKVQLEALVEHWDTLDLPTGELTPAAVVFLLTCVPRWMRLEDSFGISEGGADTYKLVQRHLDRVDTDADGEPSPKLANQD